MWLAKSWQSVAGVLSLPEFLYLMYIVPKMLRAKSTGIMWLFNIIQSFDNSSNVEMPWQLRLILLLARLIWRFMKMPARTPQSGGFDTPDPKHWLLELNEAFSFIIWLINAIVFGYIAIKALLNLRELVS